MTDAETLALRCRQDPRWSAGEITRRGTREYAASLLTAAGWVCIPPMDAVTVPLSDADQEKWDKAVARLLASWRC